jgi:surfactin synthase thioesterase subunit
MMLMRTAFYLFGYRDREMLSWLANLLKQDLDNSLVPHSLYAPTYIAPTSIAVPMLVCGALDDYVFGAENAYQKWRLYLKDSDRLWLSEQGKHFFHYSQWQTVSNQIRSFWNSLALNQAVSVKQQIELR